MGKAKRTKVKNKKTHPYYSASSGLKLASEKKSKSASSTGSLTEPGRREVRVPFDAIDRILLVGEGDFSFSLSLSNRHGCTALTATTIESRESLLDKHPQAAAHIEELLSDDHEVLYTIDATRLGQRHTRGAAILRKALFDTIVFNFPHVGGRSTDVNRQVRANQDLVVRFLEAAKKLLVPGGKVILTVFEGQPYELWGVRNLARHAGLKAETSMRFEADHYPGYKHARTLGNIEGGRGWKGEERKARMYIFRGEEAADVAKSDVRQKGEESEDNDED